MARDNVITEPKRKSHFCGKPYLTARKGINRTFPKLGVSTARYTRTRHYWTRIRRNVLCTVDWPGETARGLSYRLTKRWSCSTSKMESSEVNLQQKVRRTGTRFLSPLTPRISRITFQQLSRSVSGNGTTWPRHNKDARAKVSECRCKVKCTC